MLTASTFQLFSFSHTPNDSRGQETEKEITNDKKWVTERTERKREKKVEKKKEDRWTHKRTDRKERKKKSINQ